ncbi:coiled-coil domain-containing protein 12-like [Lineus longissimus]|uniref:coiled-coil domain-containing protein 12-like n=1 Tax=Lineus longissimus TaxID=88925 RepID=UPI00315D258D
MASTEVGKMQDEANKRKERLKAMRDRQRQLEGDVNEPPDKRANLDSGESLPKPIFRSYKPQDERLKEQSVEVEKPKPVEVGDKVKDQLEAARPEPVVEEVDLVNLAPRKPDWDLKRDVAKKLEKLDRRTQRAIAELIRDRLQMGNEDLAGVVSAAVQPAADEDDD